MNRVVRQALRRTLGEETGAIAIIVALFMVALLVIAALVLDLGTGYDHDRELQSAADAGALAGAMELISDTGSPAAVTRSYVAQNVAPGDAAASVQGGNVSFQKLQVAARSVTVDLRENHVPFNFAQVIGTSEGAVSAHAKAELMYLTAMPIVAPAPIPYLDPAHFTVHVGRGKNPDMATFDLPKAGPGVFTGSTGQDTWKHTPDDFLLYLTGVDEKGNDVMAPFPVGSIYVPSSNSIIQSVELGRNPQAGSTTESVSVVVHTEGLPDKPDGTPVDNIPILWRVNNSKTWNHMAVHNRGSGVFSGSFTVNAAGSYINGAAMITVETGKRDDWADWGVDWAYFKDFWDLGNKEWKNGDVLAMFSMFDPGQSIQWFEQSGYTAGGQHGDATIRCTVHTRVFDMSGGESTISSKDMFFQNSFGPTGWGNMLGGVSFGDQIQVALGEIQGDPSWTLLCDGNGNKQADLGEWVPVDPDVRTGAWIGGLNQAVGKVLFVALVDPGFELATPPPSRHPNYDWFKQYKNWWKPKKPSRHPKPGWTSNYPSEVQISHLGAFQVDSVDADGVGDFIMTGHFVRYLSNGTWTDVKPDGVYVETAVLTE